MGQNSRDDPPTLAALGVLAFALANVSHEALGHGLATLAVGGKAVLLTTCYFNSSGPYSKWIPAAGGLTNLAVGLGSLAAIRLSPRLSATPYCFLTLVAAFNLFFAFGYPAYSGIASFGDWAAVISGWNPPWLWRVFLVLVSIAGYYGSMILLRKPLAGFALAHDAGRLRRITIIPYLAAILLACLAGALNPSGLLTMLSSGLPAAAAAFGLTQIDHLIRTNSTEPSRQFIQPIPRSTPWIATALLVAAFFVCVLGPGIYFSRP